MWFLQIVRSFFYVIDNTLYNFIPTVYDLLMTISRTSILTQSQIKEFADRIQMLLGVFMLFKVSFSLITYIINPDEFSDKAKGFGKLWANVIFTLIMLVLVPYAFSMAYELQAMILEDNAIGTLILGEKPENNYLNNAGQSIAYHAMIPFFSPGNINEDLSLCINMLNEDGTFNDDCSKALYDAVDSDEPDTMIENYKTGVKMSSLGLTFRLDIAKQETRDGNNFLINYMAPISTVVAVVVLLLLITFCMDVALRSVKLAFLQLIAPIPIISFVDPKSGKDGIFKKWYQMCFSTYLSLFVRLAALYFGIYVISKVNGMYDVINGSRVSDPWVQIFVIIGILMFIKQLPKILEGFGIKLDGGGFNLNPLKKFQEQAFGGKQIVGAGKKVLGAAKGAAIGTAIGAVGMASGAGFGRGISGMFGGMKAGFSGKKAGEIRKNQVARNADMRRALTNGSTFLGRRGAQLSSFFGTPDKYSQIQAQEADIDSSIAKLDAKLEPMKQRQKSYNDIAQLYKSSFERGESKLLSGDVTGAMKTVSQDLIAKKARIDMMRSTMKSRSDFAPDPNGEADYQAYLDQISKDIAVAERQFTEDKEKAVKNWMQNSDDAVVKSNMDRANQIIESDTELGFTKINNIDEFYNRSKKSQENSSKLTSDMYPFEVNKANLQQEKLNLQSNDDTRAARADREAVHGADPGFRGGRGRRGPGGPGPSGPGGPGPGGHP